MTAVLGLVGAMLGPVVIEGDVSVLGSALVAIVLGATVVLTVWKRWVETMAVGALVSAALALGVLVELDPGRDTAAAVVAASFSVLFLAAGVGHDVRRPRPRFGAELVPAAIWAFLGAGVVIALAVALQVDEDSPIGVATTLAAVWLVDLAGGIGYQLARRRTSLQHVASTLLLAAVALSFATTLRFFEGREQGFALLATAGVYLACLLPLRGRGQRDLERAVGGCPHRGGGRHRRSRRGKRARVRLGRGGGPALLARAPDARAAPLARRAGLSRPRPRADPHSRRRSDRALRRQR